VQLGLTGLRVDLGTDIVLGAIARLGGALDGVLHGLDHHHLVDGFFAGYRICDLQQFEPVCTYSDV
jgi:hypothetical protein